MKAPKEYTVSFNVLFLFYSGLLILSFNKVVVGFPVRRVEGAALGHHWRAVQ